MTSETEAPAVCPVVEKVRTDMARRAKFGLQKYGVTLADNPADLPARLQHLYEELMDGAAYARWALDAVGKTPAAERDASLRNLEALAELTNRYAAERDRLAAEVVLLRVALDPFARIWRINAPLNPDPHRPLAHFIPGAWPLMADAKRANDALRAVAVAATEAAAEQQAVPRGTGAQA